MAYSLQWLSEKRREKLRNLNAAAENRAVRKLSNQSTMCQLNYHGNLCEILYMANSLFSEAEMTEKPAFVK